ncbi:ABC transporter ATP-binding protein [Nannocystis sp. ILAH1]|uniref:ABC transporter ATP-binding protein n=1 Tax=unclassified Nannocystis TaxID=2627009 RepID=UPI00226FC93E|nr:MULTISPECIES: ABC transporter ATP-binding protein [unclassified Nannocystis]MCY0992653.1 ABC transporter ATP-binding protein [Nannocystis sp. ILAH1]MCY1070117.1 ABC transporter ATP-binding protein [Nannocystis sp. RBIL2]
MQLQIRNLSKTYPNGVRALRGVDLTIGAGMFGLLGPNGAGKSSLMRTIATLQDPDTGSVRFGDIDVLAQKDRLRGVLGYLPQEFGLYPNLSAEAILDHFAVLKGIVDAKQRKAQCAALLEQTNLTAARKNAVGGYSGGMKQRLGIAIALLGRPQLVIVDEPTAGLDPTERHRFLNLLADIGEDVVVILSTHIVEDVRELCSQFAIIAAGEVKFSGAPAAVIDGLRGKIWRRVVSRAELEDMQRKLRVISTRLVTGRPVIHVFHEGSPGPEFEAVEPDLEDVYFYHITGAAQGAASEAA